MIKKRNDLTYLNTVLRTLKDRAFVCHKEWVNRRLAEKYLASEEIVEVSDGEQLLEIVKRWDYPKEMDLAYLTGKVAMLEEVIEILKQAQKSPKIGDKLSSLSK